VVTGVSRDVDREGRPLKRSLRLEIASSEIPRSFSVQEPGVVFHSRALTLAFCRGGLDI